MAPPRHTSQYQERCNVCVSSGTTYRNKADMRHSQRDHLAARIPPRDLHGKVLMGRLVVRRLDAIVLWVVRPIV